MGIKVKIIGIMAVMLLVGSLTFWAHVERKGRQEAEKQVEDGQRSISALLDTITSERESAERTQALAQSVQEKLDVAESRYDRAIADAMRNGAGLHILADCPQGAELPETSAPAGNPDATSARVSRSTQVDIHRLRRDAERAEVMISGLQGYIRTECNL